MKLLIITVCLVYMVTGSSIPGYKPLTPEERARLRSWTEDDEANIWELSGQYQGDIILTPEQQRNGVKNNTMKWPNNEIPYMFGGGLTADEKNFINFALKDYVTFSCVRPKLITAPAGDYVLVQGSEEGCFSAVGRSGGRQILNLESGSGCHNRGTILHEFLHALGFLHQQSATERDEYVVIVWNNIEPNALGNFFKDDTNNYGTPYDYKSVMHYHNRAFAINKLKYTIETIDKDYQNVIGQREGFSEYDIIKLNRMYNCPGF